MWNKLQECCDFTLTSLSGTRGWVVEMFVILLIVLVFNFFAKWGLRKLHYHLKDQKRHWHDSFVRALYRPLSYYVWFFAGVHILELVNQKTIKSPFFDQMNLWLKVTLIISLGWFFFRWKKNVVEILRSKSRTHEIALDIGKIDVINKLVTILILFVNFILLMEATNSSMTTLIAFGGVGGLAIAFASQEIISNFFAGLMIYVTQPFSVSDYINIPEKNIEGSVEEIGWYMTRIRNIEKRPIYIPNAIFSRVVVITPSRMSHRLFKETLSLRFKDIPSLPAILNDIHQFLLQNPDVDHRQRFAATFNNFGAYSIEIEVAAYTTIISMDGFAKLRQELLLNIYEIITRHGAQMAFPQSQMEILPSSLQKENDKNETH